MALRLFAAIPMPDAIGERLVTLQRDIPGAAWRPREAFHLTLRFFGEIDEGLARDLDAELAEIAQAPFEMRLAGAGNFGKSEPTALWIGSDSPALAPLAAACEKAARRAGLPAEPRRFKPHVTLAYSRGLTEFDAALFNQRYAEFRTESFWVDQFALYSSRPTKTVSQYIEEATYPLAPQAPVRR